MKIETASVEQFQQALARPGTPLQLVVEAHEQEGTGDMTGVILNQVGPLAFKLTTAPVHFRLLSTARYVMGDQADLLLPQVLYLDGVIDPEGQRLDVQQVVFVASYLSISGA